MLKYIQALIIINTTIKYRLHKILNFAKAKYGLLLFARFHNLAAASIFLPYKQTNNPVQI